MVVSQAAPAIKLSAGKRRVRNLGIGSPRKNQFVIPPLGRKRLVSRDESGSDACGLKAGLRTALFIVSGRRSLRHEGSSENQPRRNEEHEGFFWSFLRSLRYFVVDSHCSLGLCCEPVFSEESASPSRRA